MNYTYLYILISMFFMHYGLSAQDCQCKSSEVELNRVRPCSKTIGEEVVVSSVQEFWAALNRANNDGGNMTILFEDGMYEIASTARYPYITASNMVFRSKEGNRDNVILTGGGMRDVNPLVEIVLSVVGDNVTIADLTIRDVGNHGISIVGDNLFVHNVRIQNTFEQMIKGNRSNDGSSNGIVQCCLLEYTNGVGPQWYIGGLDIHSGKDWVVRDNIFKDISSPSRSQAEHAIHFWDESENILAERNIIIGCDRGIGYGLGTSPVAGGMIRNNMIFNDGSGAFDDVGIGLESASGVMVYNNSIHIEYQNAIEYRFAGTNNSEIINNVCNQAIRSRNGGQASLSNNVTNGMLGWYSNRPVGNLRLTYSIPSLVDQGADLNEVVNDIDQWARPEGNGYDIGAHEYHVTTTVQDGLKDDFSYVIEPNPALNSISVKTKNEEGSIVSIIDIHGNTIQTKIISGNEVAIDISKLNVGTFMCLLTSTNGQSLTKQFIVIK